MLWIGQLVLKKHALRERLEDALLDFRPKAAQCPQLSRLDGVAQACAVAYAEAVGEQLDPFGAKPGQREQLEQARRCREILGLNPNTLASRMRSLGIKRKALKEELDRLGVRSKIRVSRDGVESGGQAFSRGAFYTLLRNPIYVGEIRHKGVCYSGQHAPIVDRAMWDKVAQLVRGHSTGCGPRSLSTKSCVLIGKLFDESG
jgi:hypothetical protein